jgi:protein-S-isoprenylcysteine O-methyltransferase Ste14
LTAYGSCVWLEEGARVNLGEAILFGSVPLLVWFMIFFALNALTMPLIEEAHLESRLGSDYVTYKRTVPR